MCGTTSPKLPQGRILVLPSVTTHSIRYVLNKLGVVSVVVVVVAVVVIVVVVLVVVILVVVFVVAVVTVAVSAAVHFNA